MEIGIRQCSATSDVPPGKPSGTPITWAWDRCQGGHGRVAKKYVRLGEPLPQCCKSRRGLPSVYRLNI
jgi:hypothetical protein